MDGIFVPISDNLQMSNLEYYLLAILTFISDFQASFLIWKIKPSETIFLCKFYS